MEEKIAGILEEIYTIDPGLKNREDDIVGMLTETLKAEPDFEVDEEFVFELKKELLEKPEMRQIEERRKISSMGIYKRTGLLVGIIVIVLIIIIFALAKNSTRYPGTDAGTNIRKAATISSKVSIAEVKGNAFGVLSNLSGQQNSGTAQNSGGKEASSKDVASAPVANNFSTGSTAAAAPLAMGGGGASSSDAKMMPPYRPTYYSYVYKGDDFTQDQSTMNVLKRVTGENSAVSAIELAQKINLNLFDFGKLNDSKVANISFFEDKDYGYRADVDFAQESVSLYKNWTSWPNIYADCKDEACYTSKQLKASDVPADDEIISATNEFLSNYNVDLSAYGKPQIDNRFRVYATGQSTSGTTSTSNIANMPITIPEEISVIYPLQVSGMGVYESYGDVAGLNVSYNIRDKKVSSVYNLTTHSYQSSGYDAETDVQKILDTAKNIDGNITTPPLANEKSSNFETVELELGTPALSYEHFWRYESNGQSSEFLVPALVFPIKNNPATGYYGRNNVVVPLIKDFQNQNSGGGIAVPMEGVGEVKRTN